MSEGPGIIEEAAILCPITDYAEQRFPELCQMAREQDPQPGDIFTGTYYEQEDGQMALYREGVMMNFMLLGEPECVRDPREREMKP